MAEPARKIEPEAYPSSDRPNLQSIEGGGQTTAPAGRGQLSAVPNPNPIYDRDDSAPVIRPNLRAIQGRSEGDGKAGGQLASAPGSSAANSLSPGQLETAESKGADGAQSAVGAKEQSLSGVAGAGISKSMYNPIDSALPPQVRLAKSVAQFFATNKKKKAAGGVAGLTVVGLVLLLSIAQGPLQLIHLSQILRRPFSSQQDSSDTRIKGMLRAARSGEVGETRVSYLGSRTVARTNEKRAKVGIETEATTDGGGRPLSIKHDTSKMAPGETTEKVALDFAEKNGIPHEYIVIDPKSGHVGGTFYVRNPSGGAIPDNIARAANKGSLDIVNQDKRFGKIITSLEIRQVNKFNGNFASFHVFKRLKVRSLDGAAKWNIARQAKNAERSEKAKARAARIKEKLGPVSKPIAIVGAGQLVLCLAKDVAHETPLATYENVKAPAKKATQELINMGDQEKAMNDFDITQPGAVVQSFTDKDGKNIWQGKALSALAGSGVGSGEDLSSDVKGSFSSRSPEADIESVLNSLGGDYICSTTGMILGGAVGLAALVLAAPSGGSTLAVYGAVAVGSTAVTVGAVSAITTLMPKILADKPLISDLSGPFGGNIYAFSAKELGNDNFRKAGGVEIKDTQSAEINQKLEQQDQKAFQSKSFFARMFDVHDYRSVASRTIDATPSNPSQAVTSFASSLTNIGSSSSKILSMFLPKLRASDKTYDWGFPQYGFTQDELNDAKFENPYDNAEKVAKILDRNNSTSKNLVERATKCFGVEITKGDNGWQVGLVNNPDEDPEKEVIPSTAKYIDANCADKSDDWLRMRFFILDSRTMEAYSCYEGDEDSCAALGLDSGNPSPSATASAPDVKIDTSQLGRNSDNLSCADGTKDLGVVTTKYTGTLKKESGPLEIRLCQVTDIPGKGNDTKGNDILGGATVDARVSAAWEALAKKAKADGIDLVSSSSFRLADSCNGTGNGDTCARPGQSFHQTGLAIDFANMYVLGPSTTDCSVRARADSSGAWKWLLKNAEDFGIKQYTREAWHWDPSGLDNRCGATDG